jgi:hypothetical protein
VRTQSCCPAALSNVWSPAREDKTGYAKLQTIMSIMNLIEKADSIPLVFIFSSNDLDCYLLEFQIIWLSLRSGNVIKLR